MNWNNKITSFNLKGLKVIRADNTLVCVCEKVEDAKLIAAAPELLQALEHAKAFLAECSDWMGIEPNNKLIQSAIDKATK